MVPLGAGREQGQVVTGLAHSLGGAVQAALMSDVALHADYRLDARLLAGLVELHRTENVAVVGDGQSGHLEAVGALGEVLDAAGPVEQAVVAVNVEVYEVGHGGSLGLPAAAELEES